MWRHCLFLTDFLSNISQNGIAYNFENIENFVLLLTLSWVSEVMNRANSAHLSAGVELGKHNTQVWGTHLTTKFRNKNIRTREIFNYVTSNWF